MEHFSSNFVQTYSVVHDGRHREVTESISIRNGKGHKTVIYRNNGNVKKTTHKLTHDELTNIMNKKFMPELFTPCHDECKLIEAVPEKARAKGGKTKRSTKKKEK